MDTAELRKHLDAQMALIDVKLAEAASQLLVGLAIKETRLMCAKTLCETGDEQFIAPVIDAMQKMTWAETEELAGFLPGFGYAAVYPLIKASDSGKKSSTACAMRALGAIGGPDATEALVARLIALPTKAEPIEALVMIGTAAVPYLHGLINHHKADVRTMAVYALGKIGDKRVLDQVEELAETDRSEKVRTTAYIAATWLRGEQACTIDLRNTFGDIPAL